MTLAGVLQDDVSVHGALRGAATAAGAGTDLGVLGDVYGVMWLGDPDGLTACIRRLLDAGMSIVCVGTRSRRAVWYASSELWFDMKSDGNCTCVFN